MRAKTILFASVTILLLLSTSPLASANIFSEVWNKITGMASFGTIQEPSGPGIDIGAHYECEDNMCVRKLGFGQSECSSNSDCLPDSGGDIDECLNDPNCVAVESHLECLKEQCVLVRGGGPNLCASDTECVDKHTLCQNEQCFLVSGPGEDECSFDSDCRSAHTECLDLQCVVLSGPGVDECEFDVECLPDACTDSDTTQDFPDGINPFTQGTTSNSTTSIDDWCKDREHLVEYFCNGESLEETQLECGELGDFECGAGACVQRTNIIQLFLRRLFGI